MNLALTELGLPIRIRREPALTDEELMRFCGENEMIRVERDRNGELILMSPSDSEGGSSELDIGAALLNWARADGRGKAFGPNAGFTLRDGSMRAADAAWLSLPRWKALTDKQRKSYAPICPEFIIEIRSESDRLKALRAKMQMWIDNGAELAWLIDPERKAVEIYRPNDEPEIHENPSSVRGSGPVAGFELILSEIWA